MYIPINKLPSNFKPYPFKSFKIKAMSVKQALDLGSKPSLDDIARVIQELCENQIDANLLVPIDLKYILAVLAFHAFPNQTWSIDVSCPHCHESVHKILTMKDFPPVPSLEDDDPYPLTIDTGTHVYSLKYASAKDLESLDESDYLHVILAHLDSIDGSRENMADKILSLDDFGVLSLMLQAIEKYFRVETYSTFTCDKCGEEYRVPMSAVEVTQYTPFLDKEATSKYKVNFRI